MLRKKGLGLREERNPTYILAGTRGKEKREAIEKNRSNAPTLSEDTGEPEVANNPPRAEGVA